MDKPVLQMISRKSFHTSHSCTCGVNVGLVPCSFSSVPSAQGKAQGKDRQIANVKFSWSFLVRRVAHAAQGEQRPLRAPES